MLIVGSTWAVYADSHQPEPQPYVAIQVPETRYIDREVPAPPSKDCVYYTDQIKELIRGQHLLSQTKGELKMLFKDMKKATDSSDLVEVQRKLYAVDNQMNNSWGVIGAAEAKIQLMEEQNGGKSPCLK